MSYVNRHKKLAVKLAEQNQNKFKLGAVLAKGGRVISTGINLNRTHPLAQRYSKKPIGYHAELAACLRGREMTQGCTIYICRVLKKDGKLAMAKPCPCCTQILQLFGVDRIYYTAKDGSWRLQCS